MCAWRRIIICVIVLLLFMAALPSCTNKNAPVQVSEDIEEEILPQIVNPIEEAESLEKLNLLLQMNIKIPEEASLVKYYLLRETLFQAEFEMEGIEITFRAGKTDEDISGVYLNFENQRTIISGDGKLEAELKYNEKAEVLAQWYDGENGIIYSVYAPKCEDIESFILILENIMQINEQ